MTELLSDIETPSDAELISRVRGGDVAAYGELFSRHVEAANRLGRQLARGPDVDDLVSEAFAKVLQILQSGGGPDVTFRAYLLTSVRRLHVDRVRASSKLQTSDDMTQFDPGIPFQDTAVADFETGAAAKAFASLPERWQLVLWHLEVEGEKPADIAPLLGMSPNSVSALAYRAREGLRQAFLTMHLADISADDCRWVNEHLGAYVRKGLSRRDSTKVENHLDECPRCMAMYLELTEVNSNLAGIIAPLLLGAAAASYCASTGTAAGITGVSALIGRARDFVTANAGASTAGAVAAGVAAVATAGVMVLGPDTARVISADQPATETTAVPDTAPAPAVVPPVEVEERTTPERQVPSDEETAGAAGDALDEPGPLDDPAPGLPVAVPGDGNGAPDGGAVDQPGSQPGDGSGDDSGPDPPGGPDGPGAEGPGGPGTDGPGREPGTDGPGQQPGGNEEPPGGGGGGGGDGGGDGDGGNDTPDDGGDGDEPHHATPAAVAGEVVVTAVAPGGSAEIRHLYAVTIAFSGIEAGTSVTLTLEGSARFCTDTAAGCGGTGQTSMKIQGTGSEITPASFLAWLPAGRSGTLLTITDGAASTTKVLSPGAGAGVPDLSGPPQDTAETPEEQKPSNNKRTPLVTPPRGTPSLTRRRTLRSTCR